MDKYFRAVGFSHLKDGNQLDSLIQSSFQTCESKYKTNVNNHDISLDCFKYYGKGIGLGLSGKMGKNETVVLNKCFPYAESDCPVGVINVEIEDHNNDRLVLFDDKKTFNQFVVKLQKPVASPGDIKKLSIAALSAKGKILLPVVKSKKHFALKKQENMVLRKLMQKVSAGNKKAEQKLIEHLDKTSSTIRERLGKEDFFSIVEGFFQPNDESAFSYDILADIINVETITNSMTDEKLYCMTLDVTGTKLKLYINHSDLIGAPIKGMRFWGVCTLNGDVYREKSFLPHF